MDVEEFPVIKVQMDAEGNYYDFPMEFTTDQVVEIQGDDVENFVESMQLVEVQGDDVGKYEDFSSEFTTDQVFETRDELLEWAKETGKTLGMILNIWKSSCSDEKPRVQIGCERGGYRKKRSLAEKLDNNGTRVRRQTGTKKCGCPFLLKGNCVDETKKWQVNVVCGHHNHPLEICSMGHSGAGRLTEEENSLVVRLTSSGMSPSNILNVLKEGNAKNATTMRHLYNVRSKLKRVEMGERLQLQQLIMFLSEGDYMCSSRRHETTEVVKDLFFAHPESMKLFKSFPHLLLMDATYKTSMYRWPLFQVVGITSTLKTFSVCFALSEEEGEDSFAWALEKLSSLLESEEFPRVVVTNGEVPLMNAVKRIFPEAKQLLSSWHIAKDVLARSKKEFSTEEMRERFNSMWFDLVSSLSVEAFNRNLVSLESDFRDFPKALEYVRQTWLDPYKEMFVALWTDRHLHFGTASTSHAESAHSKLKTRLKTFNNDFMGLWKALQPELSIQMDGIKASFEKSLNMARYEYHLGCYNELRGFITGEAFDLVVQEKKKSSEIGSNVEACDHYLQHTHGLPCAHLLIEYEREGRAIPLSTIHPLWKKLQCEILHKEPLANATLYHYPEFISFAEHFEKSDLGSQRYLLKRLKELATPSPILLVDSLQKVPRSRGRPKGCKDKTPRRRSLTCALEDVPTKKQRRASKTEEAALKEAFPTEFVPFIKGLTDVPSDGHCGFRVVALALGKKEDHAWAEVREDLLLEMKDGQEFYTYFFGGEKEWASIYSALDCQEVSCSISNGMCIPEMGHLIASRYDVVVVHISKTQCSTFLPLKSSPNPTKALPVVALGCVGDGHFVHLQLRKGCPIPPVTALWRKCSAQVANGWLTPFAEQMDLWNQVIHSEILTSDEFLIYE